MPLHRRGGIVHDVHAAVLRGDDAGGGRRAEHRRDLAEEGTGHVDGDDPHAIAHDLERAGLQHVQAIASHRLLDQAVPGRNAKLGEVTAHQQNVGHVALPSSSGAPRSVDLGHRHRLALGPALAAPQRIRDDDRLRRASRADEHAGNVGHALGRVLQAHGTSAEPADATRVALVEEALQRSSFRQVIPQPFASVCARVAREG